MSGLVLLSTYNGEKYLRAQLDSLLSQDRTDFSILVRDDGSTDATHAILDAYRAKVPDRLKVVHGPNVGVTQSFFKLIELAGDTADWCAFCDQDDVWLETKLSAAVAQLRSAEEATTPLLYCARTQLVDHELAPIGLSTLFTGHSFQNLLFENCATGCTIVMNNSALKLAAKHLANDAIIHDWWMATLVSATGRVIFDPVPRTLYRQHGANQVGLQTSRWREILRHVKTFYARRRTFYTPWMQAAALENHLGGQLSAEKARFLRRFVATRASFLRRLSYALFGPVWRQKKIDRLVARVFIAIGWY